MVDVLMTIRQIKQAWEKVKSETITKRSSQCGAFLQEQSTEDPFADLKDDDLDDEDDANVRLQQLVDGLGSDMTAKECTTAEDALWIYVHA